LLNATKDGVQGNTEIVAKMIQKDVSGSGFSSNIKTISKMEPKTTILEGLAISEKISNNTADDVRNKLFKLGFIK
jgi:hypothetical protein